MISLSENDLNTMLVCSLKYALYRKTYITEVVAGLIRKNKRFLKDNDRGIMLRDLKEYLNNTNEYNKELVDRPIWAALYKDLKKPKKKNPWGGR